MCDGSDQKKQSLELRKRELSVRIEKVTSELEKLKADMEKVEHFLLVIEEYNQLMQIQNFDKPEADLQSSINVNGKYANLKVADALMDIIKNDPNADKEWLAKELTQKLYKNGLNTKNASTDLARLAERGKLEKITSEFTRGVKYKLKKVQ
jgi:hypothetical protein